MKKNRIAAILLTLCLLLALPYPALAITADLDPWPEPVTVDYQGGELTYEPSTGRVVGLSGFSGKVELPEKIHDVPLRILGSNSILWDSQITELVLPHGMEEVGASAVNPTETLRVLRLSDTVERIDPDAVYWTETFEGIVVPEGNPYLRNGKSGEITSKDGRTLLLFPRDAVKAELEPQVREIGERAIRCMYLKELILPEGLESIREEGCTDCFSLKSVLLPLSISSIGEGAFAGSDCRVEAPKESGIFFTGSQGELYGDGGETLLYCPNSMTALTVRPGTRRIGAYAVSAPCLETLTLPEGLVEIGVGAFSGSYLKKVEFPSTLVSIGDHAFVNTQLQDVVLPEGVRSVGNHAFASILSLRSIVLPASLEEIGVMAADPHMTVLHVKEGTPAWQWAMEYGAMIRLGAPEEYGEDFPEPVPGTPFVDLRRGTGYRWSLGNIRDVYQKGILKGVSRDFFGPDELLTRGMFAALLYRAEGSPAVEGGTAFADVPEDVYYADAVRWASETGVMQGTGETAFSPLSAVTREQAVTALHRLARMRGGQYEVTGYAWDLLQGFPDADAVSGWAREGMAWAADVGVIYGNGEKLLPGRPVTREVGAAFLSRFLGFLGDWDADAVPEPQSVCIESSTC